MKQMLIALMVLAAVAPLAAEKLADFTEGMGRVSVWSPPREVVAQPKAEVVDDAGVASGKALKVMTSKPTAGSKFTRYDVVLKLDEGQAAKAAAKNIAFDVWIGDAKAFGWGLVFFFKAKRGAEHIAKTIITSKTFTAGQWCHFKVPVSELKNSKNTGITLDEAGLLVLTFFYYAPVEIRVANIEFAE